MHIQELYMDVDNLRAFAAIAETGSFSAAAERLHLTQPAISKRIANLETQLDVSLFDRAARRVSLTEAGRALLGEVPRVEQSLEQALRAVHELRGEPAAPCDSPRATTSACTGCRRSCRASSVTTLRCNWTSTFSTPSRPTNACAPAASNWR
jgi:molybdenum-dependent DNA-binding transcriptional regulator ModE